MESSGERRKPHLILEQTVKTCADAYAKAPLDADNLTKWAGGLIELSQFNDLEKAKPMLMGAVSKLEQALQINPSQADALWLLGRAHTYRGLFYSDLNIAKQHFDHATLCFQQAVDLEPSNEIYKKSLEMKALLMHSAIYSKPGSGGASCFVQNIIERSKKKKKKESNLKYAVFGGVILSVGLVAWFGMAKSRAPPL